MMQKSTTNLPILYFFVVSIMDTLEILAAFAATSF
jgi:hypothetical protein